MSGEIKKPVLKLTGVKTFRGREGDGFNATLWVNGKKTAFVIDSAQGGCYDYEVSNREMFAELERYVTSLPAETVTEIGGTKLEKPFESKPDMDTVIDHLFIDHLKEKDRKKMEKQMQTSILVGVPGAGSYRYFDFKKPLTSVPKEALRKNLEVIKARMKPGEQILNTNMDDLNTEA